MDSNRRSKAQVTGQTRLANRPKGEPGRLSRRITRAEEDEVVRKLGEGVSRGRIAREMGLTYSMVLTLAARAEAAGLVAPLRARQAAAIGMITEEYLEEKRKDPGSLTGVEFGILFDKGQLLANEPTEIVETRSETPDDLVQRIRDAARGVVVDVEEVKKLEGPKVTPLEAALRPCLGETILELPEHVERGTEQGKEGK